MIKNIDSIPLGGLKEIDSSVKIGDKVRIIKHYTKRYIDQEGIIVDRSIFGIIVKLINKEERVVLSAEEFKKI